MLSQIHKRNKEKFEKKLRSLGVGGMANKSMHNLNRQSILALIDGMVEMVDELLNQPLEGSEGDDLLVRTAKQLGAHKAMLTFKSLLLAQREIIEKGE